MNNCRHSHTELYFQTMAKDNATIPYPSTVSRLKTRIKVAKTFSHTMYRTLSVDYGHLVEAASLKSVVISLFYQINMDDHRQLVGVFAKWTLQFMPTDSNFHRKIIFNDEAHFYMNRYVNNKTVEQQCLFKSVKCIPKVADCMDFELSKSTVHIYLRTPLTRPLLSTPSTEG